MFCPCLMSSFVFRLEGSSEGVCSIDSPTPFPILFPVYSYPVLLFYSYSVPMLLLLYSHSTPAQLLIYAYTPPIRLVWIVHDGSGMLNRPKRPPGALACSQHGHRQSVSRCTRTLRDHRSSTKTNSCGTTSCCHSCGGKASKFGIYCNESTAAIS